MSDFIIENGVLKQYTGPGGDVVIPEGVTSIGSIAFKDCKTITGARIPDSVTTIGGSAFLGCENLTAVDMGRGVKTLGNWAFCRCGKLRSVILPEGLRSIGDDAFSECQCLGSVIIPDQVVSIGNNAFFGCRSLTAVQMPGHRISMGHYAFKGCRGLADKDGFVVVGGVLYDYFGSEENLVLPAGITTIDWNVFCENNGLKTVTIPAGVTGIYQNAFAFCRQLTSVTLPEGLACIDAEAFSYCMNLTSVNIPQSVHLPDRYTFEGIFHHCPLEVLSAPGRPVDALKPFEEAAAVGYAQLVADGQSFPGKVDKSYRKYIVSRQWHFYSKSMSHPALLRYMISRKLIPADEVDYLLSLTDQTNHPDLKTEILQYAQTAFPHAPWDLNL